MLMANSLSMLTERIDVMIRAEMRAMGLSCKSSNADGDIIKGLKNYSEKANAAMYWFERDLQRFIDDCTFGSTLMLSTLNDNHRNHLIAFTPIKRTAKALDMLSATLTAPSVVPQRFDCFVATLFVGDVLKIAPAHRMSTSTRAPPFC